VSFDCSKFEAVAFSSKIIQSSGQEVGMDGIDIYVSLQWTTIVCRLISEAVEDKWVWLTKETYLQQ